MIVFYENCPNGIGTSSSLSIHYDAHTQKMAFCIMHGAIIITNALVWCVCDEVVGNGDDLT